MLFKPLNITMHDLNAVNIDISYFGEVEVDCHWRESKVCSPFTRIYMILEGEGYISDDNRKIKMVPGGIYIIPSWHEFSYNCTGRMKKIFFHLQCEIPQCSDCLKFIDRFVVIENASGVIKSIADSSAVNTMENKMRIKQCITDLVFQCICEHSSKFKNIECGYSQLLREIIEYINNNLNAQLKITDIAQGLHISLSLIQKTFKREMGLSPGKYIDNMLMERAERMIRTGNQTIKDISFSLGYCDPFYFSERFKKHFGVSPSVYKNCV